MTNNEKKFWDILTNLFVGAEVKGKSGFINLMVAKQSYFKKVKIDLLKQINDTCKDNKDFKDELYDKLYSFFHRYFSESGSIYYNYTPLFYNIYTKAYNENPTEIKTFSTDYEQIISNKQDTSLFYKTQMLYYVKSDKIFKDLEIEIENKKYIFDVSNMEGKKANEKKSLVYELKSIENKSLTFNVIYSEKGKTTKTADIVKVAKQSNIELNEEDLKKAFQVFEKQSNVDYFINKDAKRFLTEQLDMWIYQYMFSQEVDFDIKRFKQIQDFKKVAYKLINFISQFENELVKIWNKPRFSLNSNYVISLKTLKKELLHDEYIKVLDLIKEEIKVNKYFFDDIIFSIKDVLKKPLQKIYVDNVSLINDIFEVSYVKQFSTQEDLNDFLLKNNDSIAILNDIFDRDKKLNGYFASYNVKNNTTFSIEDIYFDTKYISFDNTKLLDLIELKDLVDGYLIKSENYQALNSIFNRYKHKIDLVYIDPPFNTGDDFAYIDKFQDSTWLSLLNDRLELTRELLSKNGNLYLHLDHNCNYLGRELLQKIFPDCFRREIIWNTSPNPSGFKTKALNFVRQHDTIFYCSKSDKPTFNKMWRLKDESNKEYGWLDFFSEDKENIYIEKCKKNERELEKILVKNNENLELISLGDVWNDIYSMMFTQNMTRENWSEDNTQKPENLLRRIIQTSTNQKNIVMDFFVGSGTTIATAHKLNRKWIGIDMGQFIEKITLKRMKTVLLGDIKPKLSEDIGYSGGGIFKYYELEQYEQILRSTKYQDTPNDYLDSKKSDEIKDCFLFDEKLSEVIISENDSFRVDLSKLYPNIDLKETIHNLTGKRPKEITDTKVIFEDKEYELLEILKPLLVW